MYLIVMQKPREFGTDLGELDRHNHLEFINGNEGVSNKKCYFYLVIWYSKCEWETKIICIL